MRSPLVCDSAEMEELLIPIIERLEKKDFDLPPLPQIANQVLALITDPEANSSQLTKLIKKDPVLTAKLLKTANSAGCGASRQIETVEQAVAWLGLNFVAGSAFALSFQSSVFNDRGYEAEVKGLWAHAIATGFYAKALAGMIGQNQDVVFLCGLLHNIGKPFVVHTVNEYHTTSTSPLPWATIFSLMDQSYVEVGRQLADEWNFPSPVKEAINLHQPHSFHLATDPAKGAALTCLAKHLATYHVDSVSMTPEMVLALPVTEALKIPHDVMDSIFGIKALIHAQIDSLLI